MTQEDRNLLLHDLSTRLPHRTIINVNGRFQTLLTSINLDYINEDYPIESIKPYLRPISSLTQKERDKFCDIGGVISHRPSDGKLYLVAYFPEALDYLNSIHADYRGMIEKGLAIEVTDENNPYK